MGWASMWETLMHVVCDVEGAKSGSASNGPGLVGGLVACLNRVRNLLRRRARGALVSTASGAWDHPCNLYTM